jgi:hypothetical protein
MAWRFLRDEGVYVDDDGNRVSQSQLRKLRNSLADAFEEEAAALVGLLYRGVMTLGEWVASFASLLRQSITAGALLAAGGIGAVSRAVLDIIDSIITKHSPFAEQFVRDIGGGAVSEAQAAARAQLYAGASVESYEITNGAVRTAAPNAIRVADVGGHSRKAMGQPTHTGRPPRMLAFVMGAYDGSPSLIRL